MIFCNAFILWALDNYINIIINSLNVIQIFVSL